MTTFIKKSTLRDVLVDDTDNPLPVTFSTSTGAGVNIGQLGGTAVGPTNPFNVSGDVGPLVTSLDWKYAALTGGITDTSDVVLSAAAGAGLYNVLQSMQIINTDATVGTEVVVKDGSTVIWRGFAPASIALVTQPSMVEISFSPPLAGSANTAMNAACITTSSQTYINAQGTVVG